VPGRKFSPGIAPPDAADSDDQIRCSKKITTRIKTTTTRMVTKLLRPMLKTSEVAGADARLIPRWIMSYRVAA
jgi:hypothetical protein